MLISLERIRDDDLLFSIGVFLSLFSVRGVYEHSTAVVSYQVLDAVHVHGLVEHKKIDNLYHQFSLRI